MKAPPPPAQPMTALPSEGWAPVPVERRPERPVAETVKRVFLVIALALLAISLAVAYFSANAIVSRWFEEQWVPIARLVLALLVAAASGMAVLRLTRKR